MKTQLISLLFAGISIVSWAQEPPKSQVPSVVLNSFNNKFPSATGVEWEQKQGSYEAEFDIGRVEHKVLIDASGKIIRHKEEIEKKQLPEAIHATIGKQYASYRIDDIDKIESDGKVTYKVELKSSSGDRKVFFKEDGSVVNNPQDW